MTTREMLLSILLLTDANDFESVLPALSPLAGSVRRAPLTDSIDARNADVAIVDARFDPAAARMACYGLTANAPTVAVLTVVVPASIVTVDVDWNFDDVILPGASTDELQVRMRLALNRRRGALDGTLKFGDLSLHPNRFTGSLGEKNLSLTLTEFKLLNFLVQHAGHAFSRTRLMHEVWGHDIHSGTRTIDVHVGRLRAKLGAEHKSMVDTVRGVGYMAATPPQPEWIVSEPTPKRLALGADTTQPALGSAWLSSDVPPERHVLGVRRGRRGRCGTRHGYTTGCRCAECKAAQANYLREYRARKRGVDLPTRRPGRPRRGEEATPLSLVPRLVTDGGTPGSSQQQSE